MKKKMLGLVSFVATMVVTSAAFAQDMAGSSNQFDVNKWGLLAAGLAIGIAAFGGSLGQGKAGRLARCPRRAE